MLNYTNRQISKSLFALTPVLKQQLEMFALFTSIKTTNKRSLNVLCTQAQIFRLLTKHEGRTSVFPETLIRDACVKD